MCIECDNLGRICAYVYSNQRFRVTLLSMKCICVVFNMVIFENFVSLVYNYDELRSDQILYTK